MNFFKKNRSNTLIRFGILSMMFLIANISTVFAQVSPQERQALIDLYNSTNGDSWAITVNNTNPWLVNDINSPVSNWNGVTVEDNKVTGVYLFGGGVAGPLPNSIGDLIHLKSLTITRSGGLSGGIPASIGNLTELESIDLSSNQLTEPLPIEFGNLLNLKSVNLYRNRITGTIPNTIGNLTNLTSLSLGENFLSGSIPPEIGNLVNLTSLNLFQNQLTGSIPSSIGNLTNLVGLALSRNGLTGAIPTSIVNLTKITGLDISSNQLSDPIPPELGNMTNLTGLNLYRNKITGTIPVELTNLTNLTSLSLGENLLTGSIPSELGILTNLTGLNLFQNQLTGVIPSELGNLVNLKGLNLGRNGLTGSIPMELGNLVNLESLALNSNGLSGSIPSEIGNLTNLTSINLFRNAISGSIPESFGNLINLTFLSMESNQLTGRIPDTFGNLTNLKTLYLSSNFIEGPLPDALGGLPSLEVFGIQSNKITGQVPSSFATSALSGVFKNFQLSRNELVFVDFESDFNVYKNNLTTFSYLEQSKVDETETVSASIGESITLTTSDLSSTNNSYQWFKNNVAIPGANARSYTINNIADTDEGVYHFTATNNIITDLTLTRNPITLEVGCGVSASEKQALIDLYNNTDGPNWRNSTNWLTDAPVCDWHGVTVTDGKVTNLILALNGLAGPLPDNFSDLIHLETVTFERNALTGTIPASVGNMTNLTLLHFGSNQFTGEIPASLGNLTNLVTLSLYRNGLTGSIPNEFGNLLNLEALHLHETQISGTIPASIGNLSKLKQLRLYINNLDGPLPSELGNLSSLEVLHLERNKITGAIPASLGNLSSLQELNLGNNRLSGIIPTELGNLSNLINLRLFWNGLEGEIPSELANIPTLEVISLNRNQLSGEIPSSLGNRSTLKFLDITTNNISGSIPSSFSQLSNLNHLGVAQNQMSGRVPSEFGALANSDILNVLGLQQNNFVFSDFEIEFDTYQGNLTTFNYLLQAKVDETETLSVVENGSITLSSTALTSANNSYQWYKDGAIIPGATAKDLVIANATVVDAGVYHFTATNSVVTDLTLERNPITLTITEDTCGVSEAEKQALIDLYNSTDGANWTNNTNWLTDAPVCDWYGVTVVEGKVETLKLPNNNLVGVLELTISNLGNLKELTLNSNRGLSGTLPSSLGTMTNLGKLNLSSCDFSAIIPNEITNLVNLEELYLGYNNFSGTIPQNIDLLTNLRVLALNTNQLEGTIPNEISNLLSLETLDLFGNELQGPIPTSIVNLNNLKHLRLYSNQLDGTIPNQIGDLANLEELQLGNNQLTGIIPETFTSLLNLKRFNILNNEIEGEIPSDIGNLVLLQELVLAGNNINGGIPMSISQLKELLNLNIWSNKLSGTIPSGITSLANLRFFLFYNNNFVFSDFENEHLVYNSQITNQYNYSPQAKVDETETLSVAENSSITLSSTALTSANNSYQWYKDGAIIPGATAKDLVISNATAVDAGVYHFTATNSIVTGLTLERNPITLTITEDTCGVSEAEKQALIDFYNSTGGDSWTRKDNWLTDVPVCDWYGVTVESGVVTALNFLFENNITGEIPADAIIRLTSLRRLQFRNQSQLRGAIPAELDQLTELRVLLLSSNSLSGEIPVTLSNLINLENLSLDTNALTGSIPPELGVLSNLKELDLYRNQLTGTIPKELGQLSNLGFLRLFSNQLTGIIPVELGQLSKLIELTLNNNQLTGAIPSELGQLNQLDALGLGNNQLTGSIPTELGNITVLRAITVERNNLSGVIPANISQLDNFDFFYFIDNNFVFSDFENEHLLYQSNIANYQYNRQAKVDQEETIEVQLGGSVTLSTTQLTSPNNTYTWYKGTDELIQTTLPQITIDNITAADLGEYYFTATNSIVTGLTLERNKITLVLGNPDSEDCDILEGVVDGSFESLFGVASTNSQANSDVTSSGGWQVALSTPDSWRTPITGNRSFITQRHPKSPDGEVFVGALGRYDLSGGVEGALELEGFKTTLNNLEIGADYKINFYQSNGTNKVFSDDDVIPDPNDAGNWKIVFGSETKYSDLILVDNTGIWNEQSLIFTASNSEQDLSFIASAIPKPSQSYVHIYMLIDGIKVTKVGEDCTNDISEQHFCGVYETEPTIGDLVSPIPNTNVTWYASELANDVLVPATVLSDNTVYWAVSTTDNSLPRVGVRVILENTFPAGPATQVFEAVNNPTVADLQPNGTNIQWHLSEVGGSPLSNTSALADNTKYYASENNGLCRLEVLVTINTSGGEDDCNLLDGVVDGSFEQCASVAGIIGTELTNNDLSCSSFETPNNLMYSWTVDQNNQGVLGEITNLIQPSPDGGAFASCRVYQQQSSFPSIILSALEKDIEALEVGAEYEISFYQSNGGYFGATTEFEASWRVSWGDGFGGSGISPAMLVKGGIGGNTTEAPSWDLVKLIFIATDETLKLKFTPVVPAHNNVDNGVLTHLLIDGIKINKVDGCNDDITEQRFCGAYETEPTIGDLVSPIPNTNVTWYVSESANDVLLPATVLSDNTVYWAGSTADNSLPRVGVRVILENTFPAGPATQVFEAVNNPTVADLQPNGTNVQWYLSEVGGSPLSNTSALADNTKYYASENNGLCRLEVLVTINTSGVGDDCNLLDGVVDGSFQDCALVAGSTLNSSYNNNIQCSAWQPIDVDPNVVPSTWIVDLSGSGSLNPVISSEVRQSPDGGIFASALVTHSRGATSEIKSQGFKTTLSNLEIGATYTVSFYQSQGGGFEVLGNLTVPNIENVLANWRVFFGNEVKNSNLIPIQSMSDISSAPVWEKQEITFVPTATEQELSFVSYGALINIVENVFYYNLLIDGIKVTKEGEDCTNDIAEQEFCLSEGIPTINDLASPFPNSIAWFENETGGAPLPSAQQITETVVLWAEGNSSNPRVAVRIVIKDGDDCYENLVQEFCADEGIPTINDLASPFPNSIAWFENETGGAPLPAGQQITETVTLWAEGNSSNPRVEVQIIIVENCSGIVIQRFCILNGDLIIGDLQSPFSDGEANWFLTELDKALILPEYVIPESGVYWAESIENPSLSRIPINVILDDQIPFGDTTQIFDEVDGPTVADLEATGVNIQWYLSENGEIPLTSTTPLIPNNYYYAATGDSACRLKVLVRFNAIDNCNILTAFADGSFEECFGEASGLGHNHNVTCGNWFNGAGTADTWRSPYSVSHTGIAQNLASSPDGGIFAGAIARAIGINELESFYTNLTSLKIGETYRIEFYQSNATGRFDANEIREEARWKVLFGNEIKYSEYMQVTENPVWQKSTLEFVATAEDLRLEFVASSANRTESTSYVYMLIDGIKFSQITGDGTECPDDIIYETQSFCTMANYPTVADLLGPDGVTDPIWYSSEEGGVQFSPDDFLVSGGPFTPVVEVYWAESSQYEGRKPVRVILDEGIPVGSGIQVFENGSNPTIADLEVTGNNVLWYDTPTSQEPLPTTTPLQHLEDYYAAHNGLECRLAVDVRIETSAPEVEGVQIFCESDNPTVADLIVFPTEPTYTTAWYSTPTGGTPLADSVALVDGTIYYVSQNDGNAESESRASVFVIVRSVPAPTGPTQQTVYTNDTATVSDLIAYGFGIVWYDGDGVILSPDEPLEEGGIYYASQTDFSGQCTSVDRLAVQVSISPELPPEYFSCEKFRPQPGDRYVVSGWVRESGVTITSTETKSFTEVNDKFIELLNHLRDLIIRQTPVPEVYVPSPEDRYYDELVPYINTTGIDNLTIYNLQPVKENQDGFNRTVGFSFSFDQEGNTSFTYMNPVNVYEWGTSFYRYPMVNVNQVSESGEITGPMEINFDRLTNCSTGVCLETSFRYRFNANGVTPINYRSTNNYRVSNIIKETVDFNTYVPNPEYQAMDYANSLLEITYTDREGKELPEGATISFRPQGNIIDGWQRISADFTIPNNAEYMTVSLKSEDNNLNVYFDDIRFHPFDSNMKTFVYDPETQRLQSELDENNYSTFYEYDIEGGLIRVKKETERGVYTIQETRSGNSKLNNND